MAIAHVRTGTGGETTSTTPQVTLAVAPTQGNLLSAYVRMPTSTLALTATTGWTKLTEGVSGTSYKGTAFWKIAGAGESTVQQPCTIASTGATWSCIVSEYSGTDTTAPVDVENAAAFASTLAYTTPSVTPAASVERLICTYYMATTASRTFSAETIGGTSTGVNERADATGDCLADRIVASTSGSYAGAATLSNPAALGAGSIVIYKTAPPAQDTPELYGRPFGRLGQAQMQQLLAQ